MSIETPDPNQPTLDPNLTRSYHAPEAGERAIQTEAPTIPGYAIISLLGRGGMGEVYKATHLGLHRTVALKIIRKDLINSKGALLRFQREMRAAGNLDHPNVIAAQDAGETGGVFYFAMDYCEGIDLKQYVEQKGPLAIDEACDLIHQAALGLQHINEHGLVHRDIKPSNLLLTSPTSQDEGQPFSSLSPASGERAGVRGSSSEARGVLKILDLGLARLRASEDTGQSITDTGIMMGTPDYTAPEQITNAHGVDIRADLYSLGCTFYFLLTGQAPFKGGTVLEKLRRHQVDEAPAVEELRKDVPKIVGRLIQRLLAKKPANRFTTPQEVVALLEAHRANPKDSSLLEDLQSDQSTSRIFSRRSLLVAGGATIAAGVGIPLWLVRSRSETTQAKDLSPEASSTPEIVGEIRRFEFGKESNRDVAWSPDGKHVASCGGNFIAKRWGNFRPGRNFAVHVWDAATGEKTHVLKGALGGVIALSFSRDSTRVLAGSGDGKIREWKLYSDENPVVYTGHTGDVNCLVFGPEDKVFFSGGNDNFLRWWNRDARSEYQLPTIHPTKLEGVAYLPQVELVASSAQLVGLFIWRAKDGKEVRQIPHWHFTHNVAPLIHDGHTLLPCIQNNEACLLNVADGSIETRFLGHEDTIYSIAISADGKRLLTGDSSGTIRLWAVESAKQITLFEGHQSVVTRVQFSPDGNQAISGALDGSMILWGLPA